MEKNEQINVFITWWKESNTSHPFINLDKTRFLCIPFLISIPNSTKVFLLFEICNSNTTFDFEFICIHKKTISITTFYVQWLIQNCRFCTRSSSSTCKKYLPSSVTIWSVNPIWERFFVLTSIFISTSCFVNSILPKNLYVSFYRY